MDQIRPFLKKSFPGKNHHYYEVIENGINFLSGNKIFKEDQKVLGQSFQYKDESWQVSFDTREEFLGEVLKDWAVASLIHLKRSLKKSDGLDEYLDVYYNSKFGYFLANTKTLTKMHLDLNNLWNSCYDYWIAGNVKILQPSLGLTYDKTQHGLKQLVNEVILNPEVYHNDKEKLKKMVKRQYQLMLTDH